MIKQFPLFRLLFAAMLLLSGIRVSGQSFKFETEKYVQDLSNWTAVPLGSVQHDYYSLLPGFYTYGKFKSVDDYLVLGINHQSLKQVADFDLTFTFQVKGYKSAGSTSTFPVAMRLQYRHDSLEAYEDRVVYRIHDTFHKLEILSMQVVINDGSNTILPNSQVPENVFLEGGIYLQRYDYSRLTASVRPYVTSVAANDKLKVIWDMNPSASYSCGSIPPVSSFSPVLYELEWLYVDNYSIDNYVSGNAVQTFNASSYSFNYNFNNNATRVQTSNNYYEIPLVYGRGALVYRVRTIRPNATNYTELEYGPWTIDPRGGISPSRFNPSNTNGFRCVSNCVYFIQTAYETDRINWMHNLSFAEDGKQKSVVSYFDGTGKSRQVQTRISSDPDYVVAVDQVYDKEGRPSISTLPVPVLSQNMRFKDDVALNDETGLPYRAEDFDKGCLKDPISPLSPSSKAATYYSSANPDQSGMQQYVPDAGGYPFIETIYSPDATNKVLWQGGAGEHFQRTGRGTSYAYVTANQKELNRYFGNEAGYFQFYPKQYVTDPNGQSSVSILDPSGKTVLSGLTGHKPDASHPISDLDNQPAATAVTFDVLQGALQDLGLSYRNFSYAFMPEGSGAHSYSYSGTVHPYDPGCGTAVNRYIQVPGFYKIQVTDECGNMVTESLDDESKTIAFVNSAAPYAIASAPVTQSFTLPSDRHVIRKELVFPDTMLYRAAREFTLDNMGYEQCYLDSNHFIREEIEKQPFPCDSSSLKNDCHVLRQKLKDELYPGAKYGKYTASPRYNIFLNGHSNSIFTDFFVDSTKVDSVLLCTDTLFRIRRLYDCDNRFRLEVDETEMFPEIQEQWELNTIRHFAREYYIYERSCDGVYFANNQPKSVTCYPTLSFNESNCEQEEIVEMYRYEMIPECRYGLDEYYDFNNPVSYVTQPRYSYIYRYNYQYRYQVECLGLKNIPVGHLWPGMYPNDELAVADMTPDQLIAVFNDAIAEHLLPLHPEYCKLLACDSSNYIGTLSRIRGYNDARFLNVETLNKMAAADPMNMVNDPLRPLTTAQLKVMRVSPTTAWGIDTFSLRQTYGANGFSVAGDSMYHGEISTLVLLNTLPDYVYYRDLYTRNLVNNYIGNRTLLLQKVTDGSGGCAPCAADFRMTLEPPPAIPEFYNSLGEVVDNNVPQWMRDVINDPLNTTYNNAALAEINSQVAANNAYLCDRQVEEVISSLSGCGTLTTANLNDIRAILRNGSVCNNTQGRNITPELVKTAITTVLGPGALNSLCNPYMVTYNKYNQAASGARLSEYLPYEDDYYDQGRAFLNRLLGRVQAAATTIDLDPVGSIYEKALCVTLGLNLTTTHTVGFTYSEYTASNLPNRVMGLARLINGTVSEDIYLAPHNPTNPDFGCGYNATQRFDAHTIRFETGRSVLSHPYGELMASVMMQNAFLLQGSASGSSSCNNYLAWHKRTPMQWLNPRKELGEVLVCTDIDAAMTRFMADQPVYGYNNGMNTAEGQRAARNYLNYTFNKAYSFADYQELMQGCKVPYRTALEMEKAAYELTFTGTVQYQQFVNNFKNYFDDTVAFSAFTYFNGGHLVADVSHHQFPPHIWGLVQSYIGSYAPLVSRQAHTRLSGATLAELWLPAADACNAALAGMGYTTYTTYQVPLVNNTQAAVRKYTIPEVSGGTPADQMDRLRALRDMLEDNGCGVARWDTRHPLWFARTDDPDGHDAYLDYIYALAGSGSVTIRNQADAGILPSQLTFANAVSHAQLEPVTYIDIFREQRLTDLAYPLTRNSENITFLEDIVSRVTAANGNKLFPAARTTPVTGLSGFRYDNTDIDKFTVYRTADGGAWYTLFDVRNRRYNVYIKSNEQFLVKPENYTYVPGSLKIKPSGGGMQTFTVKLQSIRISPLTVHEVVCYGFTDFELGTGAGLPNVVLGTPQRPVGTVDRYNCEYGIYEFAAEQGRLEHRRYTDRIIREHFTAMQRHFPAKTTDTLDLTTIEKQYHFTAYYYDLAGNLTRTAPPEGIRPLASGMFAAVNSDRDNGTMNPAYRAAHEKTSRYRYNTLNQLVWQETPDGGVTTFHYDAVGRMVFSQNARQADAGVYAYTLYDDLNRITESGQVAIPPADLWYVTESQQHSASGNIKTYVRSQSRKYVTSTVYDQPLLNLGAEPGIDGQDNLQNRVASVLYTPVLSNSQNPYSYFTHASHFSYDAAGNVKTLVQDQPHMHYMGQRFKRIDYDYDYLSGKVNMLSYNRGGADQYYQKYDYDADNRITRVYTSNDGVQWDRDAAYTYYKHGPLATMQLGDMQVQGIQYAYSIQGWLKAINADVLHPDADMGHDGQTSPLMPKDVFAHALDYHQDDYKPIGTAGFMKGTATNPLGQSLYNGNIARQTTAIHGLSNMQRTYQYDQLNRLLSATYTEVDNNAPHTTTAIPNDGYANSYSYDADGNIISLLRKDGSGTTFDQLQYHYQNTTNNKLDYVDDQVPARITGDLDLGPGQSAGNYVYDASGNLVKDVQGGLEEITWNAMGKVDVIRNPDAGQYISFYYDGMGQRVRKDVLTEDGNGDGDLLSDLYTRDAQGNILAVYKRKAKVNNNNFIGWLNQSIIDQHPLWTPGSGTGLPAVVATIAGPASVFREHLLTHNTVRTAWAPGYISSAYTPSQYAQHSPLIYNEVTNGLSFGDFYPVMRSYNGGAALKTEAQQNTTFAKRLLLPLFTVGEAAVSGSGTDTSLAVVLMTMKESAPDMLDYLAFQRGVTSDVTSGIDVATGMYDYLSNNPWSAYEIVDKDLGGYYGSADMTSFISAVVDQDSIYTVSFYEDAMKSGYREELYTTILSNDSLKSPALDVCVQLKDAKEPGWFDDVSEDEKVSAAYDLHTENFIGDLVSSGYLSALNEALSAYYTVYTPDGSARVQWVTYMQELTLLQQVTSGPLSSTYTFPTVTLTTPDYLKIDSVQLAEHHLYGSSRLGIKSYPDGYLVNVFNVEVPAQNVSYLSARAPWYHLGHDNLVQASAKLPYVGATSNMYTRTAYLVNRYLGLKYYELTDHLGNVNVTILDKKTGTGDGNPGEYAYLSANLSSFTDYYPYGFPIPGRSGSIEKYRFGFNGQEQDNEVYGKGNLNSAEFWMYDIRLARRWNLDPVDQISISNYVVLGNSPLWLSDPNGDVAGDYYTKEGKYLGKDERSDDKVYITTEGNYTYMTGKADNSSPYYNGLRKYSNMLDIGHNEFRQQAATVYGESTAYKTKGATEDLKKEMGSIAYVHQNNKLAFAGKDGNEQVALFKNTDLYRQTAKMQLANWAIINARTGGVDYSNGADMWDGKEQAIFPASNNERSVKYGNRSFELHMNTMGWDIKDEHYQTWKRNIGSGFSAPQRKAAPDNFGNYKNKGKMKLKSTAVYGETIFWKSK